MANASQFKDEKFFSRAKNFIFKVLGLGCMAALLLFALNTIMNIFISTDMVHEFVTIFIFFMMVFHVIVGITMAVKTLFLKADISILKLPVNGIGVFLPKLVYLYIRQLFLAFVIALPTFIMFGIKTGMGWQYFAMLVPNMLFFPAIPFLISIFLSVPVMWIIKTFKNKFLVLVIFYACLLVAGFTLYIYALKFIVGVLGSGNYKNVFDESTVRAIKEFVPYLHLALLYKNIMLLYNYAKSAVIIAAICGVLFSLIYLFADKFYFALLISSKNQPSFQKKTKVIKRSATGALMVKEMKNIFRSTNYAFQYLTVVLTTPIMVYFSSEIAASVSSQVLGKSILPGVVVFVLITFLSLDTSFSATTVTREGGNFFLTKIIPVSYTKQILVKFFIYLMISIPAIFASCLILALAEIVDYLPALLIAISLSFVVTGNISHSISMDIKRPQFKYLENGEVTTSNKNITASIGIGFAIAFIMGLIGILLAFFVSIPALYLVLFGFGVPFAIIEVYRLFYHLEKRYNEIEV